MAFRAVELHGGAIEVQSAPGRGARFDIKLPMIGVAQYRAY